MTRLLLLDRDGVLNADRGDFVKHPGELVLLEGAARAVARLNQARVQVAVCTNQSVVGRGIIGRDRLDLIHQTLREQLAREGAHLDLLLDCTDAPQGYSARRKPEPAMLLEAIRHFGAEPAATPMVGDTLSDLQAATRAGCPRMLVRTGKGRDTQGAGLPDEVLPVTVHDDLAAAVDAYLEGRL
ncbi:MAG: HAD-IIIA family hydrolase [Rhodospirillaceae bacterium]|nr:HAD-IIIA family hydrolase [Rhodospirillaceae bacterium]